jgi:predicted small secreted protein
MIMQKLVSVALVLAAFALAGCNTVQGMGKDIEKAGEAIQKSAK